MFYQNLVMLVTGGANTKFNSILNYIKWVTSNNKSTQSATPPNFDVW